MRALILNGALAGDPPLDALVARLAQSLETHGAAVETLTLRDIPVAWCQGCFECWTHTPGVCKINDAGRDLVHDFVVSDVVILVTPVSFGSYSSESKKMLDRTLGMLLPFFRRIDGEVHHSPRYTYPPAFGVLAVLEQADADVEKTVRVLVTRNAINFGAPLHAVGIVDRSFDDSRAFGVCDDVADRLCTEPTEADRLAVQDVDALLPRGPFAVDAGADIAKPKRVLLLVGSGKPQGHSTSEALGVELLERLALHGLDAQVRFVHRDAHSDAGLHRLVADVRAHDLLVIATPVYIDAVPWLVTRAMEAIIADRAQDAAPPPLAVAMLLNCGFPESRHAAVARTIGALFARSAGARWAGALQLGGGGVINGRTLDAVGRVVQHLAPALDDTAIALAAGKAIPQLAKAIFERPLMPTTLFMAAGDAGWLWTAAHEGALTSLWRRTANLGTMSLEHAAAPESARLVP